MNEIEKMQNLSLLTKDEVAELLQVTKETLTNWMNKGLLKYYKFNNRTIRYSRKHISDLLKSMEVNNG